MLIMCFFQKNIEIIKLWLFVYALSIISQLIAGVLLIEVLENSQILYTITEIVNICKYQMNYNL